jgi:DNA-binding winged helix-turn-helix (wHTH) protein
VGAIIGAVIGHRFGEFELNSDMRQLLRNHTPVHLSPKGFQLLQALVEAAPRALSKTELQDRVWPGTFVVEANLQHLIAEIRGALGDEPRNPRYVRTVHGFGYAFQEVLVRTEAAHPPEALVCRLRWDGGRITLAEGEHIVGRDPAADVVLDSSTVSRHHARIRVGDGRVTLEDLGSKNGSYVQSRRVEGPLTLADGDDIRIGMVPLRVRISMGMAPTETAILDSESR